jgi:hypothetical protein
VPDLSRDHYWSVDIPGLTADSAALLAEAAIADGYPASTVDTRDFLTMHMDRGTVEILRDALTARPSGPGTQGLLELLSDRLAAVDAAS